LFLFLVVFLPTVRILITFFVVAFVGIRVFHFLVLAGMAWRWLLDFYL
jgi:hypothetical protein